MATLPLQPDLPAAAALERSPTAPLPGPPPPGQPLQPPAGEPVPPPEPAAPAPAPPPPARLGRSTRQCLERLRRAAGAVPREELLGVLDGNAAACERLGAHLCARAARLRAALRAEGAGQLDASGGGGPPGPSTGVLLDCSDDEEVRGVRAELQAVVDELDSDPEGGAAEGRRRLSELEDLACRAETLRQRWPSLRGALGAPPGAPAAQPLAQAGDGMARTLEEALSWRRSAAAAAAASSLVDDHLRHRLWRRRERREEGLRWRALSEEALRGLEPQVAARASAVLWLRAAMDGRRGAGGAAAAADALERSLLAAEALEKQLVGCAGAVMRTEPDCELVRGAVQRLSRLRRSLADATGQAMAARLSLASCGGGAECEGRCVQAAAALRRLLAVRDGLAAELGACRADAGQPPFLRAPEGQLGEAAAALQRMLAASGGPNAELDAPLLAGPGLPPLAGGWESDLAAWPGSGREAEEFRGWIRAVLLAAPA